MQVMVVTIAGSPTPSVSANKRAASAGLVYQGIRALRAPFDCGRVMYAERCWRRRSVQTRILPGPILAGTASSGYSALRPPPSKQ